jgi:hypothetical protein
VIYKLLRFNPYCCPSKLRLASGGKVVQIRDFIMIKGYNKNFSNTLPNLVINIPL